MLWIYQFGILLSTIWYLVFIILEFAIYQFDPPSLPWAGISLLWKSSKKDDQFGESSKINCFPGFPRFFGQVLFRYQGNSPPSSKIHHNHNHFWTFGHFWMKHWIGTIWKLHWVYSLHSCTFTHPTLWGFEQSWDSRLKYRLIPTTATGLGDFGWVQTFAPMATVEVLK